jgi:hypothetical protein
MVSVLLAGLLLAGMTGCQDSGGPFPTSLPHDQRGELAKARPIPISGVMVLEGSLSVPGRPVKTFAAIKGWVEFSMTSTRYNGQYRIDLDLTSEAAIAVDGEDDLWRTSGSSHHELLVSEEGIALLNVSYRIDGSAERMNLHVRFLLTSDGIGLNSMWLEAQKARLPDAQTD